ncbi:hypothetical protein [Delftia tsuruhatensis]|jgi:hypothetical protein|nr:hypothetical protein [Delftia tsuruhatensis]
MRKIASHSTVAAKLGLRALPHPDQPIHYFDRYLQPSRLDRQEG